MTREAEGKKRLTEGVVAAALCPPEKKDVLIFDADLPGFGLSDCLRIRELGRRVSPARPQGYLKHRKSTNFTPPRHQSTSFSGRIAATHDILKRSLRVTKAGSKVFFLQYGIGGGVKRRAVIGPYGELTPAQARKRAEALRGAVREHRDPVAERRIRQAADRAAEAQAKAEAARATYTVDALIDQWRDHHLAERSTSYQARVPREMKAVLKEWLAAPAASFGQADAVHVLDEAKTERGPVAANRLQSVTRACWGWAVKRGSLASNPWTATPRPARERARERVLSDAEIAVVWKVAAGMTRPWSDIIRLMLLTGQRRQEVAGMTWSELDLDNAAWHIPGARVKNGRSHTVPLAPQAVELLRAAKYIGPLVFQNMKKTAPSGFGKIAAK